MGTGWRFRALGLASVAGSILAIVSACGGSTRTGDPVGTGGTASTGGAAGAGGSGAATTSLDVHDFDQSCEDSSDCRPVRDGDQCVCGLCPTAAINEAAVSAWTEASDAMDCPRIDCNHSIVCEAKAYGCRDNHCVVLDPPNIDPRNYDQTCRENEDCVAIPVGPFCSRCDCTPPGAVSVGGYAKWAAEVSPLICTGPEADCGCPRPSPSPAACVFFAGNPTGTCQATPSDDPAPRTTQYALDYDQRCEVASDCHLVTEGLKCCIGCAQYSAISNGAVSTWESDLTAIDCPGSRLITCPGAPMKPSGCSRVEPIAVCVEGRCDVQ